MYDFKWIVYTIVFVTPITVVMEFLLYLHCLILNEALISIYL